MTKVLISAGILMLAFAYASATVFTVGGDFGWTGPPNITTGYYESWAANKTFKGGDSLKFVWNGTHNLAIVSKEDYDNCTKVTSYFTGGTTFQFTLPNDSSGMYYFICTVDSHCEGGQKLAINVTSNGVSSPSPPDNASPSFMISNIIVAVASAMISLVVLFMFT